MKTLIKNKKAGFTDLFIFMIVGFIIVLISVVWIYMSGLVNIQLQATVGVMNLSDTVGNNASVVIENTMGGGGFGGSIIALQWISVFLIAGMILSIFIGSYLVTTKPIFFVPYLFIVIIAIVVAVPISNSYETLMETPQLASTFTGFMGANWIMLNLPMWISIIGISGGIIMFSRLGKNEEAQYGMY